MQPCFYIKLLCTETRRNSQKEYTLCAMYDAQRNGNIATTVTTAIALLCKCTYAPTFTWKTHSHTLCSRSADIDTVPEVLFFHAIECDFFLFLLSFFFWYRILSFLRANTRTEILLFWIIIIIACVWQIKKKKKLQNPQY